MIGNRVRPGALTVMVAFVLAFWGSSAAADSPTRPVADAAASGVYCQAPVDLTQPAGAQAVVNRFAVGNHESGEPVRYDQARVAQLIPVQDTVDRLRLQATAAARCSELRQRSGR